MKNDLAKIFEIVDNKNSKAKGRPSHTRSPARPDRLRPELSPARQIEARTRLGFGLGPGSGRACDLYL